MVPEGTLAELIADRVRVTARLRAVLVESLYLRLPPEAIDLDAPLFGTGLGLDSVDALELVVAAETAFGVSMPEAELRRALRSLNTLADLVQKLERARSS